MKKVLLTIIAILLPMISSAESVEIGGIWYNLISKAKQAEVTYMPSGRYSEAIEIKDKIIYEGLEYSVTSIGEFAFSSCYELPSVTIPNSVTSIRDHSFDGCTGLTCITIPNSVKSIGNRAFQNCTSLTSVTIPNSVTSIGGAAFKGCTGLTSVTIGNNVTSIGDNTFDCCSGLTSVTIGNSVTSIGGSAFNYCIRLTSVTIPNSVTIIGGSAFNNCYGLASVMIGNSVTNIEDNAFQNCRSLTSITIPNSVYSIGNYTFRGCSALTSVAIGNNVEEIRSYAFQNCSSLTTVTIPKNVTSIKSLAFANCDNLVDVYCRTEIISNNDSWGHEGLYTSLDAFQDSYPQSITLHVPASAINAFKTTEPWSGFKEIVSISGELMQKCATPTISFENGIIKFSCETEDVVFISTITPAEINKKYDSEIVISNTYKVTVYATKVGFIDSDKATIEIQASSSILGDVDGNGVVNVADHVKLSDIIMNQE